MTNEYPKDTIKEGNHGTLRLEMRTQSEAQHTKTTTVAPLVKQWLSNSVTTFIKNILIFTTFLDYD